MKATNINRAWIHELDRIIAFGQRVSPRSKETIEVLHSTIKIDMRYPVLTIPARKLGYHFLAGEAAWILSGDNLVSTIAPYSKTIANFSDDGVTFFGAYGPKVVDQLDYVVELLQRDRDTRQAVINIWRENPPFPTPRDVPCTLSCQFLVRDDRLNVFVTMRSSDIWLGVPYDLFNFTMLAAYVILESKLDARLGHLYNTAGSRHLYTKDFSRAIAAAAERENRKFNYRPFDPHGFASGPNLINYLWHLAEGTAPPEGWLANSYQS